MARLRRPSLHDDEDGEEVEVASRGNASARRTATHRPQNPGSLSPSPAASFSSDKENHQTSRNNQRKSKAMPHPKLPTPGSAESTSTQSSKRRRLGERNGSTSSQAAAEAEEEIAGVEDTRYYDPDQSMAERRFIRREYRDLARELIDSKAEYMAVDSTGLKDTIKQANDLYSKVKQTSDATLDSRLLVSTGDIAARRSVQLKAGGTSIGVDVDDFVAKCVSYMRRVPTDDAGPQPNTSTQRRRHRRDASDDSGAEGGHDEGDEMNWGYLGRRLCFPLNIRPPVSGFLLGPLSVQKRIRKPTERRAGLKKQDPRDAVRPEELASKDIERVENANLTSQCRKIAALLKATQDEREARVRRDASEDMSQHEIEVLMYKHGIADNGGIPFFEFVINPHSFGQTVENIFYVSFLIRDGLAGILPDGNMLPTLHFFTPRNKEEIRDQSVSRHQAVFHLDYETWEDIIATFNIKECIIGHRNPDEGAQIGANGWYG
ncbi:nuclear protein [Lambiella insularis]|nr:nuclear protein [Lambiella insularis]